ncbi:hypothetical protein F4083_09955 [Candidatus Poribacteria bacterium]|nr:hypothetical protein [Candidatus Poribacteria bacterium]MYI94626.1 hypothetical protein [Candidatus Poribacteria bacterium]
MDTALIFLNGHYNSRRLDFYRQEIENAVKDGSPLLCADGGIRIFDELNRHFSVNFIPDVLIGDLDSGANCLTGARKVVKKWIGKTDKDMTDGQLAVEYAIENYHSNQIIIYGGLPRSDEYETDHFLGNLKLLRFGNALIKVDNIDYSAEMRDPLQTIHYVLSEVRIERKNSGLQRVSLIAEDADITVENSQNLRWDLTMFHVDPDLSNALRNEFIQGAEWAQIKLSEDSAPVYVIHNWYDPSM